MITGENVTLERLMAALRFAKLSFNTVDENGLYVTNLSIPTWIYIDGLDQFTTCLVFSTYVLFNDGSDVDILEALSLANKINSEYKPNQIYVQSGRLSAIYYLYNGQGISDAFFVDCLKICSNSFCSGIRKHDVLSLVNSKFFED